MRHHVFESNSTGLLLWYPIFNRTGSSGHFISLSGYYTCDFLRICLEAGLSIDFLSWNLCFLPLALFCGTSLGDFWAFFGLCRTCLGNDFSVFAINCFLSSYSLLVLILLFGLLCFVTFSHLPLTHLVRC